MEFSGSNSFSDQKTGRYSLSGSDSRYPALIYTSKDLEEQFTHHLDSFLSDRSYIKMMTKASPLPMDSSSMIPCNCEFRGERSAEFGIQARVDPSGTSFLAKMDQSGEV